MGIMRIISIHKNTRTFAPIETAGTNTVSTSYMYIQIVTIE